MREPSPSRSELWQARLQRIRAAVKRALPFTSGIFAALVGVLLYNVLTPHLHQLTTREVNDAIARVMASATPPPAFSAQVYRAIQPSLVLIQTHTSSAGEEDQNLLGSGVVVDDQGDILTSLHVVADAAEIQVTFADGTQSRAQVVASLPENDIAVLQADTPPALIVPAVLGNPNALQVGDEAYVVGNPFGLYSSMSAGVISGFNRSFQASEDAPRLEGLIQIDAAVNPGNSGGPLLNREGQVVAIVTGIVNPTEQDVFIGIGFAVPIDIAASAAGSPPY
jgi:S1-C subfamily serine protease